MNISFLYPEGKKKALTFSYDDNQIYDRRLVGILNENGLKGTFHLNSAMVGTKTEQDEFVGWDEVLELYKGHEVSCHGLHHPYFGQLSKEQTAYEIREDKRLLEKVVSYPVRGMSYPFGEFSDAMIDVLSSQGMEYARTVEDTGNFNWPVDFMKWHPTCHHNRAFSDKKLLENFLNPPSYYNLPLFYIWGHSFEFHREKTWEAMETFCAAVSGKEDVWYATNIEIKDYITAVRNLVFGVGETMVLNPSAQKIWYKEGNEVKVLLPGQTVKL